MKPRTRPLHAVLLCLTLGLAGAFAYQTGGHLPQPVRLTPAPVQRGKILSADGRILAATQQGIREYPLRGLAAPLLGFTGANGGLEGVEAFHDTSLSAGHNLQVTLDTRLQAAAEDLLRRAVHQNGAEHGSVVVLEVKTGRILVSVSERGFDPGVWREAMPQQWRNRAFLDEYEPGSVIKTLVIAAMLEARKTDAKRRYPTPMTRMVGGSVIHDIVPHPAQLDLQGILRYSSNTGMARLMQDFSAQELHAALARYGFGHAPTPGAMAANGKLRPSEQWGKIGHVNHAFGQGFTATTLQVAVAFNTVANDGLLVPATLTGWETGRAERRVLSVSAAQQTRQLLKQATAASLTNKALVPGYTVAGKTGTAQLVEYGRYSPDKFISTFAGFAPADQPLITVAIMLYGARRNHHGADSSAPLFSNLVKDYLSLRGVAPQ